MATRQQVLGCPLTCFLPMWSSHWIEFWDLAAPCLSLCMQTTGRHCFISESLKKMKGKTVTQTRIKTKTKTKCETKAKIKIGTDAKAKAKTKAKARTKSKATLKLKSDQF